MGSDQQENNLFKVGDVVICDCYQQCGGWGKIVKINYRDKIYELEGQGVVALFASARKLTKLERFLLNV